MAGAGTTGTTGMVGEDQAGSTLRVDLRASTTHLSHDSHPTRSVGSVITTRATDQDHDATPSDAPSDGSFTGSARAGQRLNLRDRELGAEVVRAVPRWSGGL